MELRLNLTIDSGIHWILYCPDFQANQSDGLFNNIVEYFGGIYLIAYGISQFSVG